VAQAVLDRAALPRTEDRLERRHRVRAVGLVQEVEVAAADQLLLVVAQDAVVQPRAVEDRHPLLVEDVNGVVRVLEEAADEFFGRSDGFHGCARRTAGRRS
jgi:hypothetical protein